MTNMEISTYVILIMMLLSSLSFAYFIHKDQ